MSERGVFAVDRGIWDHPMFRSTKPFSKREAWWWLISEARWKDGAVFIDGRRRPLKRGQVAHSIRFIADKWKWPKSNVSRFLDTLKSETMIDTEIGTGQTIITICNYDKFQRVSLPDRDTNQDANRDTNGTAAGQQRDKVEDRENKETDSEANASGAVAPVETPEARLWTEGVPILRSLGVPEKQARPMIGAWRRDARDDCERVLGAILRARELAVTDPIAWITAALKPRKPNENANSVHAAADRAFEFIHELNQRPDALRGRAGEGAVRLLSKG